MTRSLKHVGQTSTYGKDRGQTPKLRFDEPVSAWRAVCFPAVRWRTSLRQRGVDRHAFDAQMGLGGLAPPVLPDARSVRARGGDHEVRGAARSG